MHRFAVLAFGCLLVAVALAFAGRPATTAENRNALAAHPAVGVWRNTIDLGDGITFPSLSLFHADGTYSEVLPDGSIVVGVWQSTGERTAELTQYSHYLIDDKLVNGEGRSALEVDEAGTTMTWTGTFVGLFEDGSIDIAVETAGPATRLEVLPVVPLSELVPGGTPVVTADLTEAGTPAP
jgi:hypothetical protein